MKKNILIFILPLLLCSCGDELQENAGRMKFVSLSDIKVDDDFWLPYFYIHKDVTLPICVSWAESHIDSSLVSKAVEGIGYSLQFEKDPELSVRRASLITSLKSQSGVHQPFSESCDVSASVSRLFSDARYLKMTGDGKYAEDLEQTMLNKVLPCVSLKGDRFFSYSPTSFEGGYQRQSIEDNPAAAMELFRALPSVGNYVYGTSKDALWVNLYMGGDAGIKVAGENIVVHQSTSYPWDGDVVLQLELKRPVKTDIRLRIPSWCKDYTLTVNDSVIEKAIMDAGYVILARKWCDGDRIELILDMPVEVVDSGLLGEIEAGKRILKRGPLVYCIEEADNPEAFDTLYLSDGLEYRLDKLPKKEWWGHELMRISAQLSESRSLTLIPYFAWGNRAPGKMEVFIPFASE